MGNKKSRKIDFPEMEAMLQGMQDLLKDEYGNPLPPNHPHYEKFRKIAEHVLGNSDENTQFKGEA